MPLIEVSVCSTGTVVIIADIIYLAEKQQIIPSHLPANCTFFTMIWIFEDTGEMLADGTEIC